MVDKNRVYAIFGIASAAAVALLTGPYRAIDVSVATFAALVVTEYSIRKVELPPWLKVSRPEVRSRVLRYAEIAKSGSRDPTKNWVLTDKSTMLSAMEPRKLRPEELAELEVKLKAAERAQP